MLLSGNIFEACRAHAVGKRPPCRTGLCWSILVEKIGQHFTS
jgi:hypothetical protein